MSTNKTTFSVSLKIKSAAEILMDEFAEAVNALKPCVAPIYILKEDNMMYLNGSSVILEVDNKLFLCTALHVIENEKNDTLVIAGESNYVVLEKKFYISRQHDFAICCLTTADLEKLSPHIPLKIDKIAVKFDVDSYRFVEFAGFPETKNRIQPRTKKFKKAIYSFGAAVEKINSEYIVVKFNRRKMTDLKTKGLVMHPDLHGMSGGAIFGIPIDQNVILGKPSPKLIGISTEISKDKNNVIGINIGFIISVIKNYEGVSLPSQLDISMYNPYSQIDGE